MEKLPEIARPEPETITSENRLEIDRNIRHFLDRNDVDGLVGFVERIAYIDPLTQVRNRRGFFHDAEKQLREVTSAVVDTERRQGQNRDEFATIFIDLDNFKKLNDGYGHEAGDQALALVGRLLGGDLLREQDVVGRLGGEEFIVSLKVREAGLRFRIAEKIRKAIEAIHFEFEGKVIPITASVGVAKYQDGETLERVIQRADDAMYAAKQAGRNRVMVVEEMEPAKK